MKVELRGKEEGRGREWFEWKWWAQKATARMVYVDKSCGGCFAGFVAWGVYPGMLHV